MKIYSLAKRILKYQLLIVVGIFVMLIFMLGYNLLIILNSSEKAAFQDRVGNNGEEEIFKKRTNGEITIKDKQNLFPVAVVIDNHLDSWPNFGLSQADIVYETLVEGSTTRFLAIFTPSKDNDLQKIGPIRSVRPYFLPLTKEYDALLAHSGGSPQALADIETLGINNLEEIAWWGPDYFWRVYSRMSPHNLFTSEENLTQAVIDWQLDGIEPEFRGWKFNDNLNIDDFDKAEDIEIKFSLYNGYDVEYKYSTSTQTYLRFQGGDKHMDELTGEQIAASNVIIQLVPKVKILDEVGRIAIDLIGSGEVIIFRDGIKIEGEWRKMNDESRTIFYDGNGDEIELKPGKIWIEIVPEDREVDY